jgi:hypothetical protein
MVMKTYKKNINLNLIKINYTYSIPEICEDFGKHRNTVDKWIREEGLKTIDNKRPRLIHGKELKEFLSKRQASKKSKCKTGELYCLKCKQPRRPKDNLVDMFIKNQKRGNLKALCSICGGKINQIFSIKKLDDLQKIYVVKQLHNQHLVELLPSSSNCDLKQGANFSNNNNTNLSDHD